MLALCHERLRGCSLVRLLASHFLLLLAYLSWATHALLVTAFYPTTLTLQTNHLVTAVCEEP